MAIKYFSIIIVLVFVSGCSAPGFLYTNMIRPYSFDFDNSSIGSKRCQVNAYRLKDPILRVGISGEWNSEVIDNAMRKEGMTKCYYADIKILSFLGGAYRHNTLILYGD